MSSIGNTPFPGQDPKITGSESAKSQAAKNLTFMHSQFQAVREKMMENRVQDTSEKSEFVSTQTHMTAMWSKASVKTDEVIQGCFASAVHQLRKAFS